MHANALRCERLYCSRISDRDHLEHEPIDDRLPNVIAKRTWAVCDTNDRIDDLHRGQPTRHVRIKDRAIRKAEPAVFDRAALAVDDDELVLVTTDNAVDCAR